MAKSDKMSILQSVLVLILLLQKGVLGFVDMTCTPTDTSLNEASTCTCTTDSGTGIAWQKNGANLMLCYTGGTCDATYQEYDNGYSSSGTNKVFTITIKAFGYSDCSVFVCKDQDTADTDQQTLTLHEFNGGTASVNSEPGSNTNGNIEITTGCVFKESDIKVNWYSVDSTNESKTFSPDTLFKTHTTCSDASKVCSGENAVTLNTGFTHTEKTGECVKLRVEVFHQADPSNKLEWTTTGEYCIGDATTTTTFTTSTTTSTSTTVTSPASTTTTPASTTRTMSIATTTLRTSITTSKRPTTTTKLSTINTSSTKSSNGGLSDKMIIVIVVVPVGVIAIVGTVIFFGLYYCLRIGKRKLDSDDRHKQRKHNKGNMRSVQKQQQQPYIL